ncbi:MAG: mandelate racemase/muconate lactonizing enzyme family protein [Woeseiaceae bacterium]
MKVTRFEIRLIEIPMRIAVEHALAERTSARNVLVAGFDETGLVGWGESCPRPYVTGETVDSARDCLRDDILPRLVGVECDNLETAGNVALSVLDTLPRDRQAAFCAAELALLDLAGHAFDVSAGDVVGPVVRECVQYTGVIAANGVPGVKKYATMLKQYGVVQAKVKTGADLDTNLELLTAARDVLGESVELRIDTNCAWDVKEAIRQLKIMEPFNLAAVEQPLAADDLAGMQELTAARIVPVVADESLASVYDARRLVELSACNIFNIRVSKVGGLLNATRIHRIARDAGLECQLGAQVGESGILSAAGRHYATRSDDVRWYEGSYDSILLEKAITHPDITVGQGGVATAIMEPGLGVSPIADRLDECTLEKIVVA